ncbi:MAG: hypothetical protein AUI15_23265 [Actinobacteria bacterium 13_2_20CM_2_66_6]|nr:MAG: hypothetical protein AUI15_23265 [Actinobacteria bacterium 13_2_20CM_2_66_6]
MSAVAGVVVAVAKFLYHYIVGDDLAVAVAMILGLAATGLMVVNGINAWGLVPPLAVTMTGVSLWRRRVSH